MVCSKCGKCCQFNDFRINTNATIIATSLNMTVGEMTRYYGYRNITVITKGNETIFRVNNKCSQLGEDNLCKIWETRPAICNGQQNNPNIVKPAGCTD